jgi:phosphoadenosine phosphosulfate reductase
MWSLIVEKRYPPTRRARYCCEWLKERGGEGRLVMTGVRWEESNKRRSRKMVELCNRSKGKSYLHPIIDWTASDVWQYIRENKLSYCSLYNEGFKRLGCIMCPLCSKQEIQREAARWPQIANAYRAACIRAFDKAVVDKLPKFLSNDWKDGNDMYDWWIKGGIKKGMKGWFK